MTLEAGWPAACQAAGVGLGWLARGVETSYRRPPLPSSQRIFYARAVHWPGVRRYTTPARGKLRAVL